MDLAQEAKELGRPARWTGALGPRGPRGQRARARGPEQETEQGAGEEAMDGGGREARRIRGRSAGMDGSGRGGAGSGPR